MIIFWDMNIVVDIFSLVSALSSNKRMGIFLGGMLTFQVCFWVCLIFLGGKQ